MRARRYEPEPEPEPEPEAPPDPALREEEEKEPRSPLTVERIQRALVSSFAEIWSEEVLRPLGAAELSDPRGFLITFDDAFSAGLKCADTLFQYLYLTHLRRDAFQHYLHLHPDASVREVLTWCDAEWIAPMRQAARQRAREIYAEKRGAPSMLAEFRAFRDREDGGSEEAPE